MELLEIFDSFKDADGRIALPYSAVTRTALSWEHWNLCKATDNFKPHSVRDPVTEREKDCPL